MAINIIHGSRISANTISPGFGVRCQPYIFEMCRCAGISDLAARVTRSRNPMNVAKATFQALKSQRLPGMTAFPCSNPSLEASRD